MPQTPVTILDPVAALDPVLKAKVEAKTSKWDVLPISKYIVKDLARGPRTQFWYFRLGYLRLG